MKTFTRTIAAVCMLLLGAYAQAQPIANAGPDATICQGNAAILGGNPTASGGNAPYTYAWFPASGLSCNTCANPVATPQATTTFVVFITDGLGATATDTVTIFVNPKPDITVGPDLTICVGVSAQLNAGLTSGPCGIVSSCSGTTTSGTLGNDTLIHAQPLAQRPSLLGNYLKSYRNQMLYKASELSAALGGAKTIGQIDFKVANLGFNTVSMLSNYTISIACTSEDSLTTWNNSVSMVYSSATYGPHPSWNTFTLDTGFVWDGVSNLVVEVCYFCPLTFGNQPNQTECSVTSYPSYLYNLSNSDLCSGASPSFASNLRPNIRFGYCAPIFTAGISAIWSPAASLNYAAIPNPVAMPTQSTWYTVSITDVNSCSAIDSVHVTVNTIPVIDSVTTTDILCNGTQAGNVCVYPSGGTAPYDYTWSIFTTTQCNIGVVAGTYSVTVKDANNCSVSASATINQPAPIQLSIDSAADASCVNEFDGYLGITATGGVPPYTYALNGGPIQPGNYFYGIGAGTYVAQVFDANGCSDTMSVTINNSYAVTGSVASQTPVSCQAGTVTLLLTGGIAPYNYSLNGVTYQSSPVFTGLAAGNYTGLLRDSKGCMAEAPFTITGTPLVALSITNPGDHLLPDTIDVTATGGCAPYLYAWSNGITTQQNNITSDGYYDVTVTDCSGCSNTSTIYIGDLNVTTNGSNHTFCTGTVSGPIVASAIGGSPPYQFSIDGGISFQTTDTFQNLAAGVYSVIVKDAANNTDTTGFTVTIYPTLNISQTHSDVICYGGANGSIDISVSGGDGVYDYQWNTQPMLWDEDITNLASGNYTISVFDNFCSALASINISQPTQLTTSVIALNLPCNGGMNGSINLSVTGGTPAYTYSWNNGPFTQHQSNLPAGLYTVTVTDAHGCLALDSAILTEPTQLAPVALVHNITCHGDNNGFIDITTFGGTLPYEYHWSNNQTTDDIGGLPAGVYVITITDNNGCSITASATINEPQSLAATVVSSGTGILPDTLHGHASGGVAPYDFLWCDFSTDSIYVQLYPSYCSLMVTDSNGCHAIDSVIFEHVIAVNDTLSLCQSSNSMIITPLSNDIQNAPGGTLTILSVINLPFGISSNLVSPDTIILTSTSTFPNSFSLQYIAFDPASFYRDTGTIFVSNQNKCVWPGDANYDGVVDNNDLLPIGLAYGTTGAARSQQDINWYGHIASDWTDTLTGGSNYKHIDCNGNGTVAADDSLAILQNFSQVHPRSGGGDPWRAADPALMVDLVPDTTHAGDTMYANLSLGDINVPASNVYGLAFTLNYDVNVVDTIQTHAVFGNSWLGTATDKISIAKDLKQGQLKCAITRIDHTSHSGSGQIGQVSFVITTDNINGKNMAYHNMQVYLSDVVMIDNQGNYLQVNAGQDSALVEFEPTGILEVGIRNAEFKIQPNPANDIVQISVSQELLGGNLKLAAIDGRVITEIHVSSSNFRLPTSDFVNGIYMLQIATTKGTLTKRLVIAR